jgi:fatty-acyl-CoA synthase
MIPAPPHPSALSPVAFLDRTAAVFPQRTAVVAGERRLTWAQLADRARRLAVALQESGAGHGERVAVLGPTSAELLEAHFGIPASGSVLVAIDARLGEDQVAAALAQARVRLLLADAPSARLGTAAAHRAGVRSMLVYGAGAQSYERFLARAGGRPPAPRPADEDELIGMTVVRGPGGRAERSLHTHRGAYLGALAEAHHARLDAGSAYLWALPTFHGNGWCLPWAVTAAAAKHLVLPHADPATVWRLLAEEAATHLGATPAALAALADHPSARELERPVAVTSSPASETVLARMAGLGFGFGFDALGDAGAGPAPAPVWDDPDADGQRPDAGGRERPVAA